MRGSAATRALGRLCARGCIPIGAAAGMACGSGMLDAGTDVPHGPLPVDERNPILLVNDGYIDNWQGEYALLFANSGVTLAGIVITQTVPWPNLDDNMSGWRSMVAAARASGMKNAPDPIPSLGPPLVRPVDRNIDSTQPNGSAGAHAIVDASRRSSLPYRPLVVAFGTRLTEAADAYLLDHTVTDRVVVVASLGSAAADGGSMGFPNGDMDPWADWIVAQKFQYVQVCAYYDQSADVPSSRVADLPNNAFGAWVAQKRGNLWGPIGADQLSVLASAMPSFVVQVQRASQVPAATSTSSGADAGAPVPILGVEPTGHVWLVTGASGPAAAARMWQMLLDPKTFGG